MPRALDVDGRAVDQQRALGDVGQHVLLVDLAHMLAGRQHGDDDLGVLHRLGGARGLVGALLDRRRDRGIGEIEGRHVMLRLGEIGGHRAAHVAETDEGDFRHGCPPLIRSVEEQVVRHRLEMRLDHRLASRPRWSAGSTWASGPCRSAARARPRRNRGPAACSACDMRYSMVIESSNERLAQRLSCSSVIAIASGESFSSAASCLSAHSPPCFFSLATISAHRLRREAAVDVRHHRRQGRQAGIGGEAARSPRRPCRFASGPERSAAPSAACRSFIFALGTWASTMPAHSASATFRRWLVSARNVPSAPCRRVRK